MDALALFLWATEIGPTLRGGRIVEAGRSREWRFHLGLDDGRWLLVSLERDLATLFVDARSPGRFAGGLPGTFAGAVAGATIEDVAAIPGERVLVIGLDRGRWVLELFPSHPTMIWEADGSIEAIQRNGRLRKDHLAVGTAYAPPPTDRPHPGLTKRIAAQLGVEDAPWDEVLEAAGDGVVVTRPAAQHLVSPVPLGDAPITADERSINDAVRAAFLLNLADARRRREAQAWRSRVSGARKRLARTLAAVESDRDSATRWPEWERMGSSLLAAPHLVRRGTTSVTIPDVFDEAGGSIDVPLDPRLDAAENAGQFLKRATRAKRGLPHIEARLAELTADVAWLAERVDRPAETWTDDERDALSTLEERHRLRRAAPKAPSRARSAAPGFHPRRFVSSDGWTILVGRNNAENDWLSLKYAKGDDIWLHAQGVAGSHVVIRRDGRKDNPSRRTLEEAAGLAATYSKAQHSAHVSVMYTLAKYVRKPRKAPPGLVTCTREKAILVEPLDPKTLARADDGDRGG